ncbi:MAG: hypothetical protein A2087_00520 [Spirochaetes bacterium GWD1_61_31]|nr:MAG: hypothetical protein A2Y37_02940 [Spirochaetes bacterium GWB1_60_80]OHD29573.1 MAG: hypothetical protein A2004_01475 [Spirochaetes bacterium GWC1_61_12]OHD37478.1 MAG: hypothetical protein A2087_00520 [Spirochaetes bacterium GWD1_61_31]OHD42013.1 MAG: hypothetical protein A2Y35_14750 [Spirochaetes bacterium GWE1_60_18]OHD61720.1 MAG: hypothetical protein A2Y32_13195 [Spirochaetes bacterium GWF1_60_12]
MLLQSGTPEAGLAGISYTFSSASYSWMQADGIVTLYAFDEAGRLTIASRYSPAGELLARETYRFVADKLTEIEKQDVVQASVVLTVYDDNGRVTQETVTVTDQVVSYTANQYDDQGRLTGRLVTDDRNNHTRIVFSYGNEDRLIVEEWFQNDLLWRRIEYETAADYTVLLHDGGILFAKEYYQADVLVRQELWRDGNLIRTRTYD